VDEARRQARAAERRLTEAGAQLAVFLRPRPDVRLYYVEATASAAGKGRALSAELAAALLGDASFRRVFTVVRQLQEERARLLGSESASLRRELSSELDARLVATQTLAGQAVQRLLVGLLAELRELRLRAAELLVDVESVATRAVLERAGELQRSAVRREAASRRHHTWPFAGSTGPTRCRTSPCASIPHPPVLDLLAGGRERDAAAVTPDEPGASALGVARESRARLRCGPWRSPLHRRGRGWS